uniref:YqgF/RNase H-like domain-containing protein n=1 Tax=Odontella aurita TaxID=265563 RepID=A0A7S4IL83_9STRA|mmetsp:Transcript_26788/g.79160  ORF Transcript_26788/g.79160 Transcript_26788/m.79160 type:complete len:252 (+) Transcript_26788:586-1341(+)
MPPTKLARCIVPPARLSGIIDWRRGGSTIMSLDITDRRIGVAIGEHPTPNNLVHKLDAIPYMPCGHPPVKRRDENERVALELEKLMKQNKVNAFVVGWPLLADGRPGGPCGKVLHMLDFLAERRGSLLTKARPFALWDERDIPRDKFEEGLIKSAQRSGTIDKWGRAPIFCETPVHEAGGYIYRSRLQFYHKPTNDSTAASLILKHFMDSHWTPENKETALHFNDSYADCQFEHAVEKYDNEGFCLQSSLL